MKDIDIKLQKFNKEAIEYTKSKKEVLRTGRKEIIELFEICKV